MQEELERKEINYARGKVAGNDVFGEDDEVIVSRGDVITDEIIGSAVGKRKLHQLMISAASSVVEAGDEGTRERLRDFMEVTENHEEEFVRGRIAGRTVLDLQGNVIVEAGNRITDEQIHRAERHGLLQELVLAVGAPGLHLDEETHKRTNPATKMGYTPYPHE